MKKNLIPLLLGVFIAILVSEGVVRGMSPVLGPPLVSWNTMQDAKIYKLRESKIKYGTPKYVFMGNSTVLDGFNPKAFDDASNLINGGSFNAGMNGAEIGNIRDFACGFILGEIRPENLVILFSNSGMAVRANYTKMSSRDSILNKYSYLYRYRNTFRDPMTINTLRRFLEFHNFQQGIVYRWAESIDDFGFPIGKRTNEVSNVGWNPSIMTNNDRYVIAPKISEIRDLIEIRDMAREKGVSLILGTMPTLAYNSNFRGFIKEIATTLGVPFIQGNDALGTGNYFQDGTHMNFQGSIAFSKFLAIKLMVEPDVTK